MADDFFSGVDDVDAEGLYESCEAYAAHQQRLESGASAPNTAPPAVPVPGEGDWAVDPDTGLVVEIDKALLKLGWTEFPRLPMDPTKEQIDEYETKLDQVTDKIAGHMEAIARIEAALQKKRDERCKPKEGAIEYWKRIAEPMARALAPYRLPRYKTGAKAGEFSKKTLNLDSAGWQFTAGGGLKIFKFDEFKEAIKKLVKEKGIEAAADIAKEDVVVDYEKAKAAVKAGKYKNLPGVEDSKVDPLAKAKVVLPKQKIGGGAPDEEADSSSGD